MGSNVELGGLARWATRQVIVTSTGATRLDASLAGRNAVGFKASSTNGGRVFVGNSSGVTSTSGIGYLKSEGDEFGLSTRAALWARGSAGSQRVHVKEVG